MQSIWVRRNRLQVEDVTKKEPDEPDDESGSFAAYSDYNKILRTWFVAFGIGGPALFITNDAVARRLASIGELHYVATIFIVGAAAQVVGALINKVANWYVYRSNWPDPGPPKWRYKAAEWLIDQFLIDLGFDAISVESFGIAAWLLLTAFAA